MPDGTLENARHNSKAGFDKVWGWAGKLGAPVNKLSNKLGAEAFWPTSLDKESDKAARILRSFCKDGFYEDTGGNGPSNDDGPKAKQKVLRKIPSQVIANAKGLAIFTTMRSGLWVSGAGGSGILVGRTESGAWSPPSGIMLHTAGLGFLVGVDIYDCVVVINTAKALEAFTKIRCTLGGEVSAVAGPVGIGGIVETELHKRQAPVWTYLKSRGFYAGVQVDGTVVIERTDENERFYHERIAVAAILAGKVRHPPWQIKTLMETIKAAQGDKDVDESLLPDAAPTPGDAEVERTGVESTFGLPAEGDPDPFGVLALEKEGFEIREAGTRSRPSSAAFEYKPSPTSPIYTSFSCNSVDSVMRRESWRNSKHSVASTDRATQTEDTGTQTVFEPTTHTSIINYPLTESPTGSLRGDHNDRIGFLDHDQDDLEDLPNDDTHDGPDDNPYEHVQEAAQAAPQLITRARLVTIPKRIPPALPPRNPNRDRLSSTGSDVVPADPSRSEVSNGSGSSSSNSDYEVEHTVRSLSLPSPREQHTDKDHRADHADGFDEVVLNGVDHSRLHSHSLSVSPITTHELDNNDTNAVNTITTSAGPETKPESEPLPHHHFTQAEAFAAPTITGEEFHSVPTTPNEYQSESVSMPGEWNTSLS